MPALPLRYLLASAVLGDNEGVQSILLSDLFSSGGSRNTFIDKWGRTGQILGYKQQNPVPVTTNVGGNATRLRGLFHYANSAGGIVTRQEIGIFDDGVAHWEFRTSVDVGITWALQSDFHATVVDHIPDFAQSGSLLTMTNGISAPQQWDGTNLTVAGSVRLPAPTFVSTGAGNLTGNIAFRVLPMVGNTPKLSSAQSINYSLIQQKGTVTWTADPDITVTGYQVYRTTGTGLIFYFCSYADGHATVTATCGDGTDTDVTLITGRVLQEYGDPPPVGAYFAEMHQQRMFFGRVDDFPRRWYFADPGLPYSVYTGLHFIDFTDAEAMSDVSTGATGDYESMLVVWLERSVWTLSGTGELIGNVRDFRRRRTDAQIGCVSHRTVARIPAGSKYTNSEGNFETIGNNVLAYLTPLLDIRIFDGNNDTIISAPKQTTLSSMNYTQRSKSFAVNDRQRHEVTWVYASGFSTEPNTAITWNYQHGTWYERDWPFCHAIECESGSLSSFLLAGEPDLAIGGLCYLLWNGFTANGNALHSQWESKTLFGVGALGDPDGLYQRPLTSHRKRWRHVDMLFNVVQGGVTLTLEWIAGDDVPDDQAAFGSRVITFPSSILTTSDGATILTSDGSEISVSDVPAMVRTRLQNQAGQYLHSRGCRLRLTGVTSTGQWFLAATNAAYQVLPGRKRFAGGAL